MNSKKSIATLVTELQEENENLQFLYKLFNTACKHEFGHDIKELHRIIEKLTIYERKAEKANPFSHSETSSCAEEFI